MDYKTNDLKKDVLRKQIFGKSWYIRNPESYITALMYISDFLTNGHGVKVYRYQTTRDRIKEKKQGNITVFDYYKDASSKKENIVFIKCE